MDADEEQTDPLPKDLLHPGPFKSQAVPMSGPQPTKENPIDTSASISEIGNDIRLGEQTPTLTRRDFLTGTAVVGAAVAVGGVSVAAQHPAAVEELKNNPPGFFTRMVRKFTNRSDSPTNAQPAKEPPKPPLSSTSPNQFGEISEVGSKLNSANLSQNIADQRKTVYTSEENPNK